MRVLIGAKEIAAALGVRAQRVPALRAAGAPIRVLYVGRRRDPRGRRYLADGDRLAAWLRCSDA